MFGLRDGKTWTLPTVWFIMVVVIYVFILWSRSP